VSVQAQRTALIESTGLNKTEEIFLKISLVSVHESIEGYSFSQATHDGMFGSK